MFRSDSPADVRYPLVSSHPTSFTLENAMPEESGWYICETDLYMSFVYINITIPLPPPIPQRPRNIVNLITPPERKTDTPAPTGDKLQVYTTFQQAWQDKEVTSQK